MKPIQIKVNVDGIDSQAIPMHLPVVLTTAISQDKLIQQNAATRFLSANPTEVERQISEILVGETRAIMATMLIEQINADRNTFLGKVRESLEQELQKVGYELTNINISEITDDADYIRNMGKKAATKAKANAEADIAEQTKQGNVKIANTRKEEEIAVSQAERDKQISVNQAKQEQEVKVAEINREKEIKLAEADKER
jgi:flotillin